MTSPASPDLTPRPPSDSRVSMTELVLPSHANAVGTMFGGTLMAHELRQQQAGARLGAQAQVDKGQGKSGVVARINQVAM